MLTQRFTSYFLAAIVVIGGLTCVQANRVNAADCACEAVCQECPPDACNCPCKCCPRKRPNYVYKALDTVAGGIEKLLRLDKLNCGPCGPGVTCDDGCDAAMLGEFSGLATPIDSQESLPVVPEEHFQSVPSYQEHAPGMQMRMGQPRMSEPDTPEPYIPAPDAPVFQPATPPQIHQPAPLSNPFLDDANVTQKRRVRATNYNQSNNVPGENDSIEQVPELKAPYRIHSQHSTPTKRLVRTER